MTTLQERFDTKLTKFLCCADLGGSWKDKCKSNMAVGKDMLFNHFEKLFTADIVPYAREEFVWVRHCLCTIFACCLLPAERVTPGVRRRVEAACCTYYALVLDLIQFGIYTEEEMVNLYFIQVGVVIARSFGSGGGMILRESIAEVQERFWKKLRDIARNQTARGGGHGAQHRKQQQRPAQQQPEGDEMEADGGGKSRPTFDVEPVEREIMARYDVGQLWQCERGSTGGAGATSVAGINSRCGPRWLDEQAVLETEWVVPVCMFAAGRCMAEDWDTVVRVMGWEGSAYHTATNGDRIVHCCESAGPGRIPDLPTMTVCAGVCETDSVVVEKSGQNKVSVYWAGERVIRRTGVGGAILETKITLPKRPLCASGGPAKNVVRQLCEAFYLPAERGGVAAQRPVGISNAEGWKQELFRLACTEHSWDDVAETDICIERIGGSAADGWPPALTGHIAGEALVIDEPEAARDSAGANPDDVRATEQSTEGELYRAILAAQEMGVGRATRSGRLYVPVT